MTPKKTSSAASEALQANPSLYIAEMTSSVHDDCASANTGPISHRTPCDFVVIGTTLDGRKFRPSDWTERLCDLFATRGADRRTHYSPHVRPGCWINGASCVIVSAALYLEEPMSYNFLVHFAQDNALQVSYDLGTAG